MRTYILLGLLLTIGVAYCVLNDEIRIVRIIRGADDSSKSSEEKDSASGAEEKADSGELKAVKASAASSKDKADSGEQNVDKDRAAAVDTAANLQESSGETVVTEPTTAVVEEGSGADETFFPGA